MSYSTSAELLAGFKFMAHRPDTDESLTDAEIYILLTEGQKKVYGVFALHVPEVLYGAPAAMSTSDSGATWAFASSVFPVGNVEIRIGTSGRVLVPGTNWDSGADYVWEGDTIRIPNGKTLNPSDGLYSRHIAQPSDISAAQEPTLEPSHARSLILYYALYLWAERGAGTTQADPNRFLGLFQSTLMGDPRIDGDIGILPQLKRQGYGSGMAGLPTPARPYTGPDFTTIS